MTSNARRPGFRLWGGDSADEPGEEAAEQAAGQVTAASSEQADASVPATDGTAAEPGPASTTRSEPTAERSTESNAFLSSLVSAMRSVAEEARDGSLGDFRATVERRIEELEAEATTRGEDLRRQADLDAEAIGSWERREIERVRAEAETKARIRREELDQQLSDHQSSSGARVATMRGKLAEHERALSSFFSELSEIADPTLFVTKAKQMPRPPLLGEVDASPAAAEPAAAEPAAAEPAAAERPAADPSATEAPAPQSHAAEPARPAPRTLDMRLADLGVERESAAALTNEQVSQEIAAEPTPAAPDEVAAATPEVGEQRDRELADRLAELDSKLSDAPPPEAPSGNGSASPEMAHGETSTPIVVKGLGSFGAITSFKQALERVDGVAGVTLSLGPTGEFVYRASHAADFDVITAVRSVEGSAAEIERVDGAVRVTVSRSR